VNLLYALLGRQVAYYRNKAALTQEELAEATKYSVDFISLVAHSPCRALFLAVAASLDIADT
jgi:transcriptional regulator with XRE-family HTH domain